MVGPDAVFLALDLVRNPSLAGVMRRHRLPNNVLLVIRVAAGSIDALAQAESATGKGRKELRRAAKFYIQQVLWNDGGDCYRALGVTPDAPQKELVEHLRWLMKWLHPDRGASELNKLYATRVLKAWDQLKTADRRARYDSSRTSGSRSVGKRRTPRRRSKAQTFLPRIAVAKPGQPVRRPDLRQMFVIGAIAATALMITMLTRFPQ
jgi:hypothetical protein